MSTPPNFGGEEIERGLEEDLRTPITVEGGSLDEELGAPEDEAVRRGLHPEDNVPFGDHEAHAPGEHCALCGAAIQLGEEVRRRLDGQWVHESCPRRT